MEPKNTVDAVRALAEAQYGVVARRQLLALGLGEEQVKSWGKRGRLIRRHRAVYALGHRVLTQHGRWMAAVLAAGDGAVLSHRSAAALWGMRPPGGALIEVTVTGDWARTPGDGIKAHRSAISVPGFATVRSE